MPPAPAVVTLSILRQDAADRPQTKRWERFEVARKPGATVASALADLALGDLGHSTPPAWESGCLGEVCGACTMSIDGRARQACGAYIDELSPTGKPIRLAP